MGACALAGHCDKEPMDLSDDAVFLPMPADYEAVQKEFTILIARVLVRLVPCLLTFKSVVPEHINHKHSADTSKSSIIVSGKFIIIMVKDYTF